MSTGTGNLPNQNMDFVPLATLPAADLDKLVDNIEALADGSGIGDGSVSTAALADANVTNIKLSTTAITLGYSEGTSNQSGITTATDITGTSVTVTIPDGGRRLKITGSAGLPNGTNPGDRIDLALLNGVTAVATAAMVAASYGQTLYIIYTAVVAAGTYTYKLKLSRIGTGTVATNASGTNPAYVLIELI